MNVRTLLFAFLLLLLLSDNSKAEIILWDDLLRATEKAGKDLAAGKDRKGILNRLVLAIEKNPKSKFMRRAARLSHDLALSIKKEAANLKSEKANGRKSGLHLMDTKIHCHYIAYSENWKYLPNHIMKKHPQDPLVKLLRMNRKTAIELLIPMLEDFSPTRSYRPCWMSAELPTSPRVCDMALYLIIYHAKCRFFVRSSGGFTDFSKLAPAGRLRVMKDVTQWWKANKEKTVAEGIRSQIPHQSYAITVWLLKYLAKEGKEDRQFAIDYLKKMIQDDAHHAPWIAVELAKIGDVSSVDIIYSRIKKQKPNERTCGSTAVHYLTDFGNRREWELLYGIAKHEIETNARQGISPQVWRTMIYCRKAETSLYSIPSLALAINHPELTPKRFIKERKAGGSYFSHVGPTMMHFQKLTKQNLGYQYKKSTKEKAAAIAKAQHWWKRTGREKYTFDNIEKMIDKESQKKKSAI